MTGRLIMRACGIARFSGTTSVPQSAVASPSRVFCSQGVSRNSAAVMGIARLSGAKVAAMTKTKMSTAAPEPPATIYVHRP